MSTVINLTDEEWESEYKPIRNHFNPTASEYDSEYTMFETYGEELQFVQNTDPAYVWTQVDGDDGGIYIVNGYASVNRIGYYITAKAHNPYDFISVCILGADEEDEAFGDCEEDGHHWEDLKSNQPTINDTRYCTRCGNNEEDL